ncbi:hypothetical protein [Staphylococcus felis]|uniref:hypothetical protein n=1 Tax=Staphylococcus felis TaxID=46127 RepID=UPI001EE90FA8|nr:hypothetical protein [Staphylococcus felis]
MAEIDKLTFTPNLSAIAPEGTSNTNFAISKIVPINPNKKDYSLNDIKIKSTKARINPLRLLSKAKSHKTASPKIIPPFTFTI